MSSLYRRDTKIASFRGSYKQDDTQLKLAPTVSVGAHMWTLRVHGRGAAEIWVPTQSVGTRGGEALLFTLRACIRRYGW